MASILHDFGNAASGYAKCVTNFANETAKKTLSHVTTQKLHTLALGTFVVLSAANMPSTEAAPNYVECIDDCNERAEEALPRMICYALCAIFASNN